MRELFQSGMYKRKSLAHKLHMAQHTLEKQLARLGLITRQAQPATTSDRRRKPVTEQIAARIRKENRDLFLEAAKTHYGRTAIRKAVSTADRWLRKNDKEWWEANVPSRIFTKPTAHVDWQDRDSKWASDVLAEAERTLNLPGRPVFISKTAIARSLKITDVITKRSGKIPLTISALQDVCEDSESLAARRIKWAAKDFEKRRISPSRSELFTRAGVTGKVKTTAKVVAELAAAMAQFHPELGLNYDVAA